MRVFIAIDLPENVKARIFHKFELFQNKNLFKGKFVAKENLHLTLKFLGNVPNEKLEEIKKKLRSIEFEKFECGIGKVGVFNENHIKIIWVDLMCENVEKLQKQISNALPPLSTDDKEFNTHVTTARVRSVGNKEELLKELRNMHFKGMDFEVNEFLLIKSELTRQGPRYEVLERYPLIA